MTAEPGLRDLTVPDGLWPLITCALDLAGFVAVRLPDELFAEPPDLPSYVIHPKAETHRPPST